MTWTAPDVARTEPLGVYDERELLDLWLDYHRATLLYKCSGLTGEQLVLRAAKPSTLSLLGLVRHMSEVERSWFRTRFAGQAEAGLIYCDDDTNPDGDFDLTDPAQAEADFATFATECDLARQAVAGHSLEEQAASFRLPINLRWIYTHMIEEYARHNGHADILREQIDGATGD